MILEAALITVSCVLFTRMGLSDAIQETLRFRSRIASCPRCCTFWTSLAYFLFAKYGLLMSVAASFICAYSALWLALIYDVFAITYNWIYESITEKTDPAEDAEEDNPAQAGDPDAVS